MLPLCICTMVLITSINVNGARNISKLEQILNTFKSDIICLQETNWTDNIMVDIKKKWTDLIFVNHGTEKSCGVAILVKKRYSL